jgi:hypothetical protein
MNDRYCNPDLPDCVLDEDVVEIPLLLPGWQATALETAAHDLGLTAGEMVRHLLGSFIARQAQTHEEAPVTSAGVGHGYQFIPDTL